MTLRIRRILLGLSIILLGASNALFAEVITYNRHSSEPVELRPLGPGDASGTMFFFDGKATWDTDNRNLNIDYIYSFVRDQYEGPGMDLTNSDIALTLRDCSFRTHKAKRRKQVRRAGQCELQVTSSVDGNEPMTKRSRVRVKFTQEDGNVRMAFTLPKVPNVRVPIRYIYTFGFLKQQ